MKAFRAEAHWEPRQEYILTEQEKRSRRVASGSKVWRNPVLEIVDLPDPAPARDELLLKVRCCGICGSDTHVYETDAEGYIIFSGPARMPCTLGHEYTAEVIEVGADVKGFESGDMVTCESVLWCGTCLPCRQGMLNQCERVELLGLTADGAFADYISVKAKYCWNISGLRGRFDDEQVLRVGALIEPVGCAYNGLFVAGGGFSPGAFAVVYGAGPIGLGAMLLLKAAGAAKVIALDILDERLDIARKMGADYVFNSSGGEVAEAILEITGGWGADVQVEAAGAARHTIPLIQKLCAKQGKVIYLGRAESYGTIDLNRIVSGANSIIGARGHSGYGIFSNVIKLLEGGRLDGASEMITAVYPFADIAAAFEASTRRKDGKILVEL